MNHCFVTASLTLLSIVCTGEKTWYNIKDSSRENCFCQLTGRVDDCCCTIEDVEEVNSKHIHAKLTKLVTQDYFKYVKLNLNRKCPFWLDDFGRCAIKNCRVDTCSEDELPPGLKNKRNGCGLKGSDYAKKTGDETCLKYDEDDDGPCSVGKDNILGDIDKTISEMQQESFEGWSNYDADSSFCVDLEEDSEEAGWVDLTLNEERYTGYQGKDANRIWSSIYKENCFLPKMESNSYDDFKAKFLSKTCLEKRVFYRTISGLHASISIHLSYKYLLQEKNLMRKEVWGPSIQEFKKRFDPENTNGNGPHWLKNLYFTYLITLRAVIKASPYWKDVEFYTGDKEKDRQVKQMVLDVINSTKTCPSTFDESIMFAGDTATAAKLKEEFRIHYQNITRIMDCVGCGRCRLWGKLQTTGIGTALKILFSSDKWDVVPVVKGKSFVLTRTEVVSLFNALTKLSSSVQILTEFKKRGVY